MEHEPNSYGINGFLFHSLADLWKSCNFAGRKQPVMGCVPNLGEVTDYMAGLFISLQSYSHSTECVCLQSSPR